MRRFTLPFGGMLLVSLFCGLLFLVTLAISESTTTGEVVWSGACTPAGIGPDASLAVKCAGYKLTRVPVKTQKAYLQQAIKGTPPKTIPCRVFEDAFGQNTVTCD